MMWTAGETESDVTAELNQGGESVNLSGHVENTGPVFIAHYSIYCCLHRYDVNSWGDRERCYSRTQSGGESVNLSGHVENTGPVFSAHYSIYCCLHRYDVNSWGDRERCYSRTQSGGESVNLSGHVENTGPVFSAHYSIYCCLHRYDVNSWGDRERCYSRTQSGGSLWISLDMLRIRVQCSVHTTVYTAVCTDMMWTAGETESDVTAELNQGGSLWISLDMLRIRVQCSVHTTVYTAVCTDMMWTAGETESDVTAELNQGGVCESLWTCWEYESSVHCTLQYILLSTQIWCEQLGRPRAMLQQNSIRGSLWISLDMLRIRVQCSVHTTVYTAVCTDMMWTAGETESDVTAELNQGGVCESLWTCWEYGSSVQCTLQYILLSAQIWCEQLGRPKAMLQQNLSFITRRSLCHLWVWETYASVVHVHYNITFITLLKMYSSPPPLYLDNDIDPDWVIISVLSELLIYQCYFSIIYSMY